MSNKIRVAIVGVGNCASSLVQGVYFYKKNIPEDGFIPGLMFKEIGGYKLEDIEFVAAFDVISTKVGRDLSEAIYAYPNNTLKFYDVPFIGVKVLRGKTLDGLGQYYRYVTQEDPSPPVDVAAVLKKCKADILINYLPVGSEEATRWYINQALEAGCGVINCIPVFIASSKEWQAKFEEKNLPLIGDDVKSQVGATIVHRTLAHLFNERGVIIDRTLQLNVGGNMDFMNMLERERIKSKKISKTQSVTSILKQNIEPQNVHIGPSDYIPWLEDRKWANIRLEGRAFGNVPINLEMKLEVWDSPNSAGVVVDAIRFCKLALDVGLKGILYEPSSYYMKSPPVQFHDDLAREKLVKFLENCEKIKGIQRTSRTTASPVNGKKRKKEIAKITKF